MLSAVCKNCNREFKYQCGKTPICKGIQMLDQIFQVCLFWGWMPHTEWGDHFDGIWPTFFRILKTVRRGTLGHYHTMVSQYQYIFSYSADSYTQPFYILLIYSLLIVYLLKGRQILSQLLLVQSIYLLLYQTILPTLSALA